MINWTFWLIAIPIYTANAFISVKWLKLSTLPWFIEAIVIGLVVPIILEEKFGITPLKTKKS